MLAERLRSSVPSQIRRRGGEYWRYGAVGLIGGGADFVEAIVDGSEEYEVGLYWNPQHRTVEGICTCPYFTKDAAICKHIWATVASADESGYLSAMRHTLGVRLVPGPQRTSGGSGATSDGLSPISSREPDRPTWRTQLLEVGRTAPELDVRQLAWLGDDRQIVYRIDPRASQREGRVVIELLVRDRDEDGRWGELEARTLRPETVARLPDPIDRELLAFVIGAQPDPGADWPTPAASGERPQLPSRFTLPDGALPGWVRLATHDGRLTMGSPDGEDSAAADAVPLGWDEGPPWSLELTVAEDGDELRLSGALVRPDGRTALSEPTLVSPAGLVFCEDRVSRLDDGGAFSWISLLRREPDVRIPAAQQDEFLETLLNLPRPAVCHLPESLQYEEVQGRPRPELAIQRSSDGWLDDRKLLSAELRFEYDGRSIARIDGRTGIYQPATARFIRRDRRLEEDAVDRLRELGARLEIPWDSESQQRLVIPERHLAKITRSLTLEGWRVEAEGQRFRRGESLELEVTSGIDWFDLSGAAVFEDTTIGLPRLLRALRRGERSAVLDDGSVGLLPQAWLERYGTLARMGEAETDGLRFRRSQIGLIDALLEAQPEIGFDRSVARAREQLADFSGVRPRQPPETFRGGLRDYQTEGLGWLHFLRDFGFGGCLADDMGLGKTVQVLALLESRREARARSSPEEPRPGPSLVVVPRSIVFNWRREAERFTPQISVLDYTGPQRRKLRDRLVEHDVVITTYGTLRRDIAFLKELELDYAVLDEAQAIKNPKSATAKAARLLGAAHRLALTGTPLENHVGELMSILDFLNPGLFGPDRELKVPRSLRRSVLESDDSEDTAAGDTRLTLIAGAVRPFILRRTKDQVAKDLPAKVEQTLFCDLPPRQRQDYDEILAHYRGQLLGRVNEHGLARSKMHVLEALLRLRQAACHPGLIDPARRGETSGKLELLLPQLEEVVEEGHKALVFSQFTSMLAIVRSRLDARGIVYEYLDGQTRRREPRIERFQEDPECRLFLISLKAGGVGLNLTAAEYVFLLDPWWNPAVEAQAIDRTHRIGQTRPVFAYSLIARDTVEEKVLALQQAKRRVAEAVVQADSSLIRNLTREELAELLS